jgi:hypothetical protein
MDNLRIEKTKYTLDVDFNAESGVFSLEGRSLPENTIDFFNPIFSFLKRYFTEISGNITMNCKMTYFNSGSSKRLMELFRLLEEYNGGSSEVVVNWNYDEDDEDQLEEGEEFAEDFDLTFNMISY